MKINRFDEQSQRTLSILVHDMYCPELPGLFSTESKSYEYFSLQLALLRKKQYHLHNEYLVCNNTNNVIVSLILITKQIEVKQ
jgi:hypothetical protein